MTHAEEAGIYQEVDGFYYYDPPGHGSYAAHTLREIADKLDEMNKPWSEQIERELNPANSVVSTNSVCSLTPETPRKDKLAG